MVLVLKEANGTREKEVSCRKEGSTWIFDSRVAIKECYLVRAAAEYGKILGFEEEQLEVYVEEKEGGSNLLIPSQQ